MVRPDRQLRPFGGRLLGSAAASLMALGCLSVEGTRLASPPVPSDGEPRQSGLGEDWPGFLGPRRDGKSTETILHDWPATGPRVLWHKPIGEGYSMAAVAGGRLFMFDRHGDRARLTAMDPGSGEELWRSEYVTDYEDYYQFSNGPRASPVVDGDRVYTFGVEGRLRCHRTEGGTLVWDVDTAVDFGVAQNFFGVGSTPLIEGDLLIALVGGSPPGSPRIHSGEVRGNGSGIVAFDKLTGEVRYRATDELASYSSPTAVTIDGRRWGFAFARGGLVGFDPASGKVDFSYPWRATRLESVNAANPVVVDDMVLICESYGPGSSLLRVRPGGYDVVWKDPPRGDKRMLCHWSTPIHHAGSVYGCSGSGSGDAVLRAIELRTGKVAWSEPGLGRVTLLYADGHLIVLGERGELRLVGATPERYRLVAEASLKLPSGEPLVDYPAWNPPILSHGLLYVRGKSRLACLDFRPPRRATSAAHAPGSAF